MASKKTPPAKNKSASKKRAKARSDAARRGWETRRARAAEREAARARRSEAARKGWETRRASKARAKRGDLFLLDPERAIEASKGLPLTRVPGSPGPGGRFPQETPPVVSAPTPPPPLEPGSVSWQGWLASRGWTVYSPTPTQGTATFEGEWIDTELAAIAGLWPSLPLPAYIRAEYRYDEDPETPPDSEEPGQRRPRYSDPVILPGEPGSPVVSVTHWHTDPILLRGTLRTLPGIPESLTVAVGYTPAGVRGRRGRAI